MADRSKLYDNPRSPKPSAEDEDVKIGDVKTAKELTGRDNDDGEYEYLGHDPDSEIAALEPKRKGSREKHDEAYRARQKWWEGESKKRDEGKPWGGNVNPGPTWNDLTFGPNRGLWRRRATPTS